MGWAAQAATAVWVMAILMSASLWWRRQQDGAAQRGVSWNWEIVYVEDSGEMLLSTVQVLGVDTRTRRLTAWCSRSGREREFRLSRIARAQDLQSGRSVNLSRWLARVSASGRRAVHRPMTPH